MNVYRKSGALFSAVLLWFCATAQAEQYTIPWFVPAGTDGVSQGVLRIVNDEDVSTMVNIFAIDDAGVRAGPATLTLNAASAVELDAAELQSGNAAKGLPVGLGSFTGNVRLSIDSDVSLVPSAYVRAADGALAAMHDTVLSATVAGTGMYRLRCADIPSRRKRHAAKSAAPDQSGRYAAPVTYRSARRHRHGRLRRDGGVDVAIRRRADRYGTATGGRRPRGAHGFAGCRSRELAPVGVGRPADPGGQRGR